MNSYTITDACTGCTLCARNCPVKAITGETKKRHEIDPELCVRCGLCGRLCAFGAILDEKGAPTVRVPKADWQKPVVDDSACAGCSVCAENCPKGCLELSPPAYHGDIHIVIRLATPDDCIGCGLCERFCPVGAIELRAGARSN